MCRCQYLIQGVPMRGSAIVFNTSVVSISEWIFNWMNCRVCYYWKGVMSLDAGELCMLFKGLKCCLFTILQSVSIKIDIRPQVLDLNKLGPEWILLTDVLVFSVHVHLNELWKRPNWTLNVKMLFNLVLLKMYAYFKGCIWDLY